MNVSQDSRCFIVTLVVQVHLCENLLLGDSTREMLKSYYLIKGVL